MMGCSHKSRQQIRLARKSRRADLLAIAGIIAFFAPSANAQQIPGPVFGLPIEGGPGVTPGPSQPDRPNPSDSRGRAVGTAYNSAYDLYDRTGTSLMRALQLPCLDADVREGLLKRANETINQIRSLAREYSAVRYGGLMLKTAPWVRDLQNLLLKVAAKPICSPETFPNQPPVPPPGGVVGGTPTGAKVTPTRCLSDDEIKKKILEISVEISKLEYEEKQLVEEASDIAREQASAREAIEHFKAVIAGMEDPHPGDPPDPNTGLADENARLAELEREEEANKQKQLNVTQHIYDLEQEKQALQPCPPSTGLRSGGDPQTEGYFGLNIGGETQDSRVSWNPNFTPPDNFGVASLSRSTLNQTGVAVSGQVGMDMHWGGMVIGGVFDATYKGGDPIRQAFYASPFGGVFPLRQAFASDFELTARARIGYDLPVSPNLSLMPYATAGLAMSQISVSDGMYFPSSFNYASSSQFRSGWAAGAGIEFRTESLFRVQLQYLHLDFGDIAYVAPNARAPTSFIDAHHQINEDRAAIGVNVSFDDLPRLLSGRH